MKILITGAGGMVGRALATSLEVDGHQVLRLRHGTGSGATAPRPGAPDGGPARAAATWDPAAGRLDPAILEGVDAVVHLAGESIAGGRWTPERKRSIRDSRVAGTSLMARTLSGMAVPPPLLLSASAIGWYGNRGADPLDESQPPGDDFLARVCREWEEATRPAADRGVRVVNLRFAMILSAAGGALPRLLPPFRLGLGGVLGNGAQYMSWISIEDVVGGIRHVLARADLAGPVNMTAPGPVTNREFTRTLARVLGRPAILPLPAFALRLAFGEMGEATLLSSCRARPACLLASGYRFRHPDLETALRALLGRPPGPV